MAPRFAERPRPDVGGPGARKKVRVPPATVPTGSRPQERGGGVVPTNACRVAQQLTTASSGPHLVLLPSSRSTARHHFAYMLVLTLDSNRTYKREGIALRGAACCGGPPCRPPSPTPMLRLRPFHINRARIYDPKHPWPKSALRPKREHAASRRRRPPRRRIQLRRATIAPSLHRSIEAQSGQCEKSLSFQKPSGSCSPAQYKPD